LKFAMATRLNLIYALLLKALSKIRDTKSSV
jgi:hypothetical protein